MVEKLEADKSFFCSELVASAYKRIGILDPDKAASSYWPGDFSTEKKSNEVKLLRGAYLGD